MKLSEGSKGKGPVSASYARGGNIIGTVSRFIKQPDIYRSPEGTEKQDYGAKKDPLAKPKGDKSLKPIKPRT
jgi:hypothetical protein